jgi:cell division septation protein DedD
LQIYCPDTLSNFWNQETSIAPATDTLTKKADTTALVPDSTILRDSTGLKTDSLAQAAPSITPNTPSFEIIIAAFHKQSEADEFIAQLAARQINAHILQTKKGGLFKISVGTFADETTAANELQKIHQNLAKNAWIYRVKPLKTKENVSTTN